MKTLLLDYGRAGGLNFSTAVDKKTGAPYDARSGTELGLDSGLPPSPAFNYMCYRRSALRFCFIATVCSSVFSVLQGAALKPSTSPPLSRIPSIVVAPRMPPAPHYPPPPPYSPPQPPSPPPPAAPAGNLSVDSRYNLLNTINSAVVGIGKLLSSLCHVWAYSCWQDVAKSRIAVIVSYLCLLLPPFFMASVPWFLALDVRRTRFQPTHLIPHSLETQPSNCRVGVHALADAGSNPPMTDGSLLRYGSSAGAPSQDLLPDPVRDSRVRWRQLRRAVTDPFVSQSGCRLEVSRARDGAVGAPLLCAPPHRHHADLPHHLLRAAGIVSSMQCYRFI